jgi:hypothetical protein
LGISVKELRIDCFNEGQRWRSQTPGLPVFPRSKRQRPNTKPHGVAHVQGRKFGQHKLNEVRMLRRWDRGGHLAQNGGFRGGLVLPHDGRNHFGQRLPVAQPKNAWGTWLCFTAQQRIYCWHERS